jgi:hypothetical protein
MVMGRSRLKSHIPVTNGSPYAINSRDKLKQLPPRTSRGAAQGTEERRATMQRLAGSHLSRKIPAKGLALDVDYGKITG